MRIKLNIMEIKYYTFFIAILIFNPGCKKYLDKTNPNAVTDAQFFKTEDDIQQFVDGLYSYMVPDLNTANYDFCSDLNALSPQRGDWAFTDLSIGTFNSTSASIATYWNYNPIRNAYVFFDKVKNVKLSDASLKLYTGSVDYLLAYSYYMMFRAYESVPIVKEV